MTYNVKAAILKKNNKPLELIKFTPPNLKKGQLLVKIYYSAICRSQLMEIEGLRGVDKYLPHMLGHEGSGVVVEVGKDVTKFNKGDEVVLSWIKSTGLETGGGTLDADGMKINYGPISTFSNYSIISENRLIKKPEGFSFKLATLFGCALPTGSGIVKNEIKMKNNSSVAIIGLGGIGMAALLMCIALNKKNIVAIDNSEERLSQAKKFGIAITLNANDINLQDKIQKIFPCGIDFCIEAAGFVKSIELGFSFLNKKTGSLVFASHPKEGDFIKINPHELISGKKIKGSWGGSVKPDKDIPEFGKIFSPYKDKLNQLISKVYSLNEINIALDDMRNKRVLRPLIKMEH